MRKTKIWFWAAALAVAFGLCPNLFAGEADINIPDLKSVEFTPWGVHVTGTSILFAGLIVCVLGAAFGLVQYVQTRNLDVHTSMSQVSNTIWETCKTYLAQQGKFLAVLWVLIALCMGYYFVGLEGKLSLIHI